MPAQGKAFDENVFLNCPFDEEYLKLLRPLLFTILALGFYPRIASERLDSLESRIDKICKLIQSSRYSIHDLSRLKAGEVGEFSRMNMPFELGIELGCRRFGSEDLRKKRCLVLEKDAHEYRKALSDLSGFDIKHHDNEPESAVRVVRDWLREAANLGRVPSATRIWYRFTDFASDFYDTRKAEGFTDDDLNMMPVKEYVEFIAEWLADERGV